MVSLLESSLRATVAQAFRGQLLPGTLRRRVEGSTKDAHGDPTSIAFTSHTFEGILDSYSARYRQQAGIPDTDVRILVIAGLINPTVRPQKDDQIKMRGRWFQVRAINEVDPAEATFSLQSFEIADPTV